MIIISWDKYDYSPLMIGFNIPVGVVGFRPYVGALDDAIVRPWGQDNNLDLLHT